MVYFLSTAPEGFKTFDLTSGSDDHIYTMKWTGASKLSCWTPVELCTMEDSFTSEADLFPDIGKFNAGPFVVSERAKLLLEPLWGNSVEFLPASYKNEKWYVLNVINVMDVVDKEKSRFKIYKSGKVGFITHAYIDLQGVDVPDIFIAKGFHPYVFINEKTKELIDDNKLIGALVRAYENPK